MGVSTICDYLNVGQLIETPSYYAYVAHGVPRLVWKRCASWKRRARRTLANDTHKTSVIHDYRAILIYTSAVPVFLCPHLPRAFCPVPTYLCIPEPFNKRLREVFPAFMHVRTSYHRNATKQWTLSLCLATLSFKST